MREGVTVSDSDVISELYGSCFRRLVVQLYAMTGDLNAAQEAVQEAYLLIAPPPPPGAGPMEVEGTSQLLRTTDGGRTWADKGTDLPNSLETRFLVVGSDGTLLLVEAGNMEPSGNRSTAMIGLDGGRHFKKIREYDRRDGGVGAAPGYAWLYGRDDMTTGGADHAQLTADGTSWTRLPLTVVSPGRRAPVAPRRSRARCAGCRTSTSRAWVRPG
ncbi:hypothetical protein ACIBEF_18330 [Micromonospora sp. NPDC050795]|uniref:hypothetical protein n=1 Tax=Micromonospora sp. NPDC050795 TaxID=3364282 RepID=UPI0037A78579